MVQQGVGANGITGRLVTPGGILVPVMVRVPMIGLLGDGVLHVVQPAQCAEDRLDQHAKRQQHQQRGAQETAVATEALHGSRMVQAGGLPGEPDSR